MVHRCDAVVVCCIDFRFQEFINQWIDEHLAKKTYDLIGFAGSTKDLKIIIKEIEISVGLHHIKQVILIHHEDCGAYGKESTPERHAADLKKAKKKILSRWPNLTVNLYYLLLNGQFIKIKSD